LFTPLLYTVYWVVSVYHGRRYPWIVARCDVIEECIIMESHSIFSCLDDHQNVACYIIITEDYFLEAKEDTDNYFLQIC